MVGFTSTISASILVVEVTFRDAYGACENDWDSYLLDKDDIYMDIDFLKSTLKGMNTTGAVGVWTEDVVSKGICSFMSASKEWEWDEQDCASEQDMIYICGELSFYSDCYESTCYQLYKQGSSKCEVGEGYLAKIESKDENEFVKQFLDEANYGDLVMIDGSDAGAEGTWVFADGEAMSFEDFDTNEPNNGGTNGEDCILMDESRGFRWIDYTCDFDPYVMYLCEVPMLEIVG